MLDKVTTADPNISYNIFLNNLSGVVNRFLVPREVKFNKRKHPKTAWITRGIIKSINFRDKLYRNLQMSRNDTS